MWESVLTNRIKSIMYKFSLGLALGALSDKLAQSPQHGLVSAYPQKKKGSKSLLRLFTLPLAVRFRHHFVSFYSTIGLVSPHHFR